MSAGGHPGLVAQPLLLPGPVLYQDCPNTDQLTTTLAKSITTGTYIHSTPLNERVSHGCRTGEIFFGSQAAHLLSRSLSGKVTLDLFTLEMPL